jgi:hypothetical protein
MVLHKSITARYEPRSGRDVMVVHKYITARYRVRYQIRSDFDVVADHDFENISF